jgi:hypothetical protein
VFKTDFGGLHSALMFVLTRLKIIEYLRLGSARAATAAAKTAGNGRDLFLNSTIHHSVKDRNHGKSKLVGFIIMVSSLNYKKSR